MVGEDDDPVRLFADAAIKRLLVGLPALFLVFAGKDEDQLRVGPALLQDQHGGGRQRVKTGGAAAEEAAETALVEAFGHTEGQAEQRFDGFSDVLHPVTGEAHAVTGIAFEFREPAAQVSSIFSTARKASLGT